LKIYLCSCNGSAQEKWKIGWNSGNNWMLMYIFAGFFWISPCVWPNSRYWLLSFPHFTYIFYCMKISMDNPKLKAHANCANTLNHWTHLSIKIHLLPLHAPNCHPLLEWWTSSHQCTSSGWGRSSRFGDEPKHIQVGHFYFSLPLPRVFSALFSAPKFSLPTYQPPLLLNLNSFSLPQI
jgi:hypothetical protein